MSSMCCVMPEPPCTASPIGLLSTSTSSSSHSVIERMKSRSFCACGASSRSFGASSWSGGMRTACPASSRFFGSVRLPFTRTSPLRMMRWMWLNDRPGKRASKKRSTRMLFSSGVTVTVCTPAEKCSASASATGGGAAPKATGASRGGRAGKRGRCRRRASANVSARTSDWRCVVTALHDRSLFALVAIARRGRARAEPRSSCRRHSRLCAFSCQFIRLTGSAADRRARRDPR